MRPVRQNALGDLKDIKPRYRAAVARETFFGKLILIENVAYQMGVSDISYQCGV